MASSSVSQEDHDVEHDFAMASRRAKVRSARANRTVNASFPAPSRAGEQLENKDYDGNEISNISHRYDSNTVVLVEPNDASPKPICRGLTKDKRLMARGGGHSGKNNKGVRDRRKLREKRRSTGVMHLPSTESTGGSTGEDENNENTSPCSSAKVIQTAGEPEEKVIIPKQGRSDSDLDADDEANNSGDVHAKKDELGHIRIENERITQLLAKLNEKEKRIEKLEMQVTQLTRQMSEILEENAKLLRIFNQNNNPNSSP